MTTDYKPVGVGRGRTLAVVGAGVMGVGVTHVAAAAGFSVVLIDNDEAALTASRAALRQSARQAILLGGPGRVNAGDIEGLVTRTTHLDAVAGVEAIVENVTEAVAVKQELWRELGRLVAPEALLMANTSAVPIATFSACVPQPGRVIGAHFMNPAPLKTMVEVVRGPDTTGETLTRTEALLGDLGRSCVVVNDSPGFVANRVLMLMVNEAARLVDEAVSTPTDIDRLFCGCFGHKTGPLATADLIGIDTVVDTLEILRGHLGDERYAPATILVEFRDAGRLGRKAGSGFHTYRTIGGGSGC